MNRPTLFKTLTDWPGLSSPERTCRNPQAARVGQVPSREGRRQFRSCEKSPGRLVSLPPQDHDRRVCHSGSLDLGIPKVHRNLTRRAGGALDGKLRGQPKPAIQVTTDHGAPSVTGQSLSTNITTSEWLVRTKPPRAARRLERPHGRDRVYSTRSIEAGSICAARMTAGRAANNAVPPTTRMGMIVMLGSVGFTS